jgi:hypothetical protein
MKLMRLTKMVLATALVALFMPLGMFAMPGNAPIKSVAGIEAPAPPPPPAVVAAFLQLTPQQTAQFLELLKQFISAVEPLEQQKQVVQHQLDLLLASPAPDPAAIGKLILFIRALDQQEQRVVQGFQQIFSGLLTSAQIEKVQAVALAAQLEPVVGAFEALYIVAPPSPASSSTAAPRH